MNLTRCAKGHYYDMDKFSMCPHCASANEGMGQTMRYTQPVNDSAFSGEHHFPAMRLMIL